MKVVCLCGSEKFKDVFWSVARGHLAMGNVVLGPEQFSIWSRDADIGAVNREVQDAVDRKMFEIHLEKIKQADIVHVINVDGYVGVWTAKEVAYAQKLGKELAWFICTPDRPYLTDAGYIHLRNAGYVFPWQDIVLKSYTCNVTPNDAYGVALLTLEAETAEKVWVMHEDAQTLVAGQKYTITISKDTE